MTGKLSLILIVLVLAACNNRSPLATSLIELGDSGMVPGKEYLLELKRSERDTLSGKIGTLSFLVRYSETTRIYELPLILEYGSLESDSVKKMDLKIPLFEKNNLENRSHNSLIHEKLVPLFKDFILEEGFFMALKTFQENSEGVMEIGLIFNN